MSSNSSLPDYDMHDTVEVSTPAQLRAIADPLRSTLLDLVLERAATVAELAAAVGRPKSTVAHHVGVLLAAELVKVVRTRRVRAIDERFYGRTARIFYVGRIVPDQVTVVPNYLILKVVPLFGGNNLGGVGGHGWLDSYWGIIVPNLVNGFGIFLLRQYMRSIPDEMLDAARIDGAGHFRIYWKVILPLSRPALAALAIFTFQFWWAALFWPLIVVSSPQLYTLPLGLALFQEQNRTVWNLIMAGSVLASLPLIVVFLLFQRQFVRGISVSGLKG